MRYKLLLLLILFFYISSFAQNLTFYCPSVEDIKKGHYLFWLPLYIDGEELASDQDVEKFKSEVSLFVVARWRTDYLETAHCFYEGTGDTVKKIIFARDAWRPKQSGHWVWLKPEKIAECFSNNVLDCEYIF